MDQTFDSFLQLDKGTVIRDGNDFPFDSLAFTQLLFDLIPWVLLQLLETQGNALALFVVVQDDDVELLVQSDEF